MYEDITTKTQTTALIIINRNKNSSVQLQTNNYGKFFTQNATPAF